MANDPHRVPHVLPLCSRFDVSHHEIGVPLVPRTAALRALPVNIVHVDTEGWNERLVDDDEMCRLRSHTS